MQPILRIIPILILAIMFRTPLQQLTLSLSHLTKPTPHVTTILSQTVRNLSTEASRPVGLKATSGIELLTFGTPNGHKAAIILEELYAAYGLRYTFQSINITQNIQKEDWFTAICPNGRIPAIVDHDRGGFAVFEGAAILSYLTRTYDVERKFSFDVQTEAELYSQAEQWVAWQHGGLGPMQGQANHFYRLAKERIAYPTQRYVGETERLYGILDERLKGRDFLVGEGKGKYSIADIASFSWVNVAYFAGLDLSKWRDLEDWWRRISEREAVQKGTAVPNESQLVNAAYLRRLKEEPEFQQKEDELKKLGEKAKQEYAYKYASP